MALALALFITALPPPSCADVGQPDHDNASAAGLQLEAPLNEHEPVRDAARVMQPKVMGDAALTAAEASALLAKFVQQPGVSYAPPSNEGWEVFHGFMHQSEISPRLCTDAHLAALAITNQWRLVSFDRDFQLFPGLNLLQLR